MTQPAKSPDEEWRRLLAGGFAFMTAPFGVHPKDRERAEEMYHFALRSGVSPTEILSEARSYLDGAMGLGGGSHAEELERVERFLSEFKLVTHKRSAWLVFWNRALAEDEANPPIVAIFDSRKTPERIADFVEQTYISTHYSLREKIHYATRPKKNPYRAQINYNKEQGRLVSITCGHNPWLEARIVRQMRLTMDADGRQLLTWEDGASL